LFFGKFFGDLMSPRALTFRHFDLGQRFVQRHMSAL
jgi:hypothetical protein